MVRPGWLVLAFSLVAATAPAAAQGDGAVRVFLSGGLQTSPEGIDVYRPVEYDAGMQIGGGIALQLHENIAFRGDFARVSNAGFEGGVLNEEIEMERSYYAASLEAGFPVLSMLTPYGLVGLGVVDVERTGPSYTFGFMEVAILAGAGVRMPLASGVRAFAQGSGWYYPNQAIDENRIDPVVSFGVDYVLPF